MRTRVLKGSKVIFSSGVRPVEAAEGSSPPSRIIASGILRLRNLAADDYTLEVTVHDKVRGKGSQAVIRQEMDFSVE